MSAVTIEGHEKLEPLLKQQHAKYFLRFLNILPASLSSHDCTRGTIAFFSICGLDVLNSLQLMTPQLRQNTIDWVYRGLIVPKEDEAACGGFLGSRSVLLKCKNAAQLECARRYQWGHLAITYTSLGILASLGDDFSRLDRKSIVDGVAAVQREDGSFSACINGSENDMRFVYCAAAICHMLDYWGQVNKEKMFQFIKNSIRYDFGMSQFLEGESHGGTTFCALAALQLSGQLARLDASTIESIKRWLIFRQVDGFQGRPNKPVDTCYSFWIGAALRILNAFELSDYNENRLYIMETQDNVVGGFSKWPQSTTDPFHTYFGLCGLSFMGEPGLAEIVPSLNITQRAYQHLLSLQERWRLQFVSEKFSSAATLQLNVDNEDISNEDAHTITSSLIKAQ